MTADPRIVRTVVVAIVAVVLISLAAIIGLTYVHQTVPQIIGHAFDVGFGALATLLASTRSGGAQDVTVTNSPENAVPVDQGAGE